MVITANKDVPQQQIRQVPAPRDLPVTSARALLVTALTALTACTAGGEGNEPFAERRPAARAGADLADGARASTGRPPKEPGYAALPGTNRPTVKDAGATGARTELEYVGFMSGSTNVQRKASVLFMRPVHGDVESYLERIEERARFVRADGSETRVRASLALAPAVVDQRLEVAPVDPLPVDTEHWFVLPNTDDLAVRSNGRAMDDTFRVAFFTGSAPRVIGLERSVFQSNTLYVYLSEPVDVLGLDPARFLRFDGERGAVCVRNGSKCVDRTRGEWFTALADVNIGAGAFDRVAVTLAPETRGSGRTVAEADGLTQPNVEIARTELLDAGDGLVAWYYDTAPPDTSAPRAGAGE